MNKTDWNKITEQELRRLYYDENISDRMIAELYGITMNQVKYKRLKWGLTFFKKGMKGIENNTECKALNQVRCLGLLIDPSVDRDFVASTLANILLEDEDLKECNLKNRDSQKKLKTILQRRLKGLLAIIEDGDFSYLQSILQEPKKYNDLICR